MLLLDVDADAFHRMQFLSTVYVDERSGGT